MCEVNVHYHRTCLSCEDVKLTGGPPGPHFYAEDISRDVC
jgi:hypothetical protein